MEIYISKILENISMNEAEILIIKKLKERGFGVITEIDVAATFKEKINKDFRPYKILGVCNPAFAFEMLNQNDKIGVLLPCNVCLQQKDETSVEVITINPLEAMLSINTPETEKLTINVYEKLREMLEEL